MIRRILGGVMRRIKNIYPLLNNRLKRSYWYHRIFPHLREYERLKQGADVICIGSTPAKNALDFENVPNLNGYNLAVGPETIFYDYQVLKNYHSYLKPGGTILFVLCPFSFLKDYYRNEFGSTSYLNIRYYPILHRALIDTFDQKLYHKYVEEPLLINIKSFVHLFYDPKPQNNYYIKYNPQNIEESKVACENRLKNWMREFRMTDLNPKNIPVGINNAIKDNIRIFQEMKTFIEERGYKAYIIIPPFPEEMTCLLPDNLVEYTLFEPVKATGFPYINYYGEKEWLSRNLYYHGFLLNASGRELLTKDILSRISI